MATIAELLVKIGVKIEGDKKAEKGIDNVRKKTKELGKDAKKTKGSIAGLAKGLGKTLAKGAAVAGVALVALAGAAFKFVKSQAETLDSANKMAAALGITVEEMQRLNFVFQQSGVSAGAGQKAILKLNEQVLNLSTGTISRSSKAFAELGVTFEDLEGKSATQQLGVISNALLNVDDLSRRSALSATLLGKSAGPELATLLAAGSTGIQELADSAQGIASQEQADLASNFVDRMGEMTNLVEGLAKKLAVDLIPPIMSLIEGFQDWAKEHEAIIKAGLGAVVEVLGAVFGALWKQAKILFNLFEPLVSLIIRMVTWVFKVTGAWSVLKKIMTAVFAPITAIVDLITLLIKGLEKFGLVAKGTADEFERSMTSMKNSADALDTIGTKADELGTKIGGLRINLQGLRRDAILDTAGGQLQGLEEEVFSKNRTDFILKKAKTIARAKKKAGKDKPQKETKQEPVSGVTIDEAFAALQSGNRAVLKEKLRDLKLDTPSPREIRPTVAIDFFSFDVVQHIKSTDPKAAGDEATSRLKKAFKSKVAIAAQSLNTVIAR